MSRRRRRRRRLSSSTNSCLLTFHPKKQRTNILQPFAGVGIRGPEVLGDVSPSRVELTQHSGAYRVCVTGVEIRDSTDQHMNSLAFHALAVVVCVVH
ncbi:hypothetical protein F2P81_019584 [Scophthalmus maximus]|uniref:Uncharacterized protein n=1 Tax=Scophthalmus maximus TaxID=52904 RepID=A0A6A4S610_SCOMX|nr:hypothetical protein F2P81_019584 [Scophthalmus maximus]